MALQRGRKRLHASYLRKLDHIRREYWKDYRPRVEQLAIQAELRANQERADKINELRRVEGMLQTMHPHSRLEYLNHAKEKLWKELKVADSTGLL